ncbi:SELS protein, partial [Amia calva]|nr:SELS protein [Amia calva]
MYACILTVHFPLCVSAVGVVVADYGWYLLFGCIAVYLLIQQLSKRRAGQAQSGSAAGSVPDASSVVKRQEALEAARIRMQEELDAKAAQYREKQKQAKEKRRQKIEMWESMKEGKSYKGNPKHLYVSGVFNQCLSIPYCKPRSCFQTYCFVCIVQQNTEEASSSTVIKPKTEKKSLRSSGVYEAFFVQGGLNEAYAITGPGMLLFVILHQ